MEQEEDIRAIRRIFCVELFNPLNRRPHQIIVILQGFRGRIFEIGQQCKMKTGVTVGEVPHLQPFQQLNDAIQAGEHRGDGNQCTVLRRDAGTVIHSRQRARFDQRRHEPVGQSHPEISGAHHGGNDEQSQTGTPHSMLNQFP